MQKNFVKIENSKDWQVLLDKVLFKTFFHYAEWEDFLEKQFKWLKFERYLYRDSVLLSMARVGNKLISHPFCEYGGPLLLTEKIDGEEFKKDLFAEFKNFLRISFHPSINLTGTEKSERVTYFIDGSMDLRKTARHEIEKAKDNRLQIEKCGNQKDLEDFYRLCVKSAKRHKTPVYPISFFNYFLDSPNAQIVLAKKDNIVIAGGVFLFYDKFVHYFQSALDPKHKNSGATYLILWEQIQKCLESQKVFDFGGTRIGSPLQVFKEGWGGKEYPIYELKNYSGGSGMGKSKLRDAYALLPDFLIEKLSPYLLKYKL